MPNVLPAPGVALYRQAQAYLATDTDPLGIVAALGQGANSIYPNFLTDGPSPDRTDCPTPFLIVAPGGARATDDAGRDGHIIIEIHDDPDQGDLRWPGLYARLTYWLCVKEWRPQSDGLATWRSGLRFESESAPNLPDQRFATQIIQIVFAARYIDRTSMRGKQG